MLTAGVSQWFAQNDFFFLFYDISLSVSSSFLSPSVCRHFLLCVEETVTWSRMINQLNISQSSGYVHALLLVSRVWIFIVTRSEVRGHAVNTGCWPTAAHFSSFCICLFKLKDVLLHLLKSNAQFSVLTSASSFAQTTITPSWAKCHNRAAWWFSG